MSRRLVTVALVGLLTAMAVVLAAPVVAVDMAVSSRADVTGLVVPSSAHPGDRVVVDSSGWPADSQVQGVVCGDLGIGGSKACRLNGAALGRATVDGRVRLEIVVAKPPRPCPCIVRISTFSGQALTFDTPLNVIGHRVGEPPTPVKRSVQMEVSEVRVAARGASRWFGFGGEATLKVTVRNTGSATAAVPPLRHGFGIGTVRPHETVNSGIMLLPGQARTLAIPVEVPSGLGGEFQAIVQMSDDTASVRSVRWSTRPWALIGLLFVMVLLAAMAGRALIRRVRADRANAADSKATSALRYPLPDVVFVEEIGGLLVNPTALSRSRLLTQVSGRITLEDLMNLGPDGVSTQFENQSSPRPERAKYTEIAAVGGRHSLSDASEI